MKQQRVSGGTYTDVGQSIDTLAAFNVACQEFPFKMLPESKELASRDWYDQHGEEVYVPADGMKFKAYDLEVTFLYSGTEESMRNDIANFIKWIYGRNPGGSPMLVIYDEYTRTGRRGVYVLSVDNELYFFDDANIDAIASFKVKFRVTDPVTEIDSRLYPIPDSSSSE